jgi:riboflavin biosynthesis pyrimidine reductase
VNTSHDSRDRFAAFATRKTQEAESASFPGFQTILEPTVTADLAPIGNSWSERLFGGPFYVRRVGSPYPAMSLVLVQSREGNLVADDPSTLGGGATDKHIVYEGLSRVAADAVLAGARTVDENVLFSIWHPELVKLRLSLGKPRHPAQAIITAEGRLDLGRALIASVPHVPLFVVTTRAGAERLTNAVGKRPWVHMIDCGETIDLTRAASRMRAEFGIEVVSVVGGLITGRSLIDADLVRDLYLTTSAVSAGEPGTGLHMPASVNRQIVLSKAGRGEESGVRFEHWSLIQ